MTYRFTKHDYQVQLEDAYWYNNLSDRDWLLDDEIFDEAQEYPYANGY